MALSVDDARSTGVGGITMDDVAREDWDRFKRFGRMMAVPEERWMILGFPVTFGGGYFLAQRFIRRAVWRLMLHVKTQIPSERSLFELLIKEGAPSNPYLWSRPNLGSMLPKHPRCVQLICPCQNPRIDFNPDAPVPPMSHTYKTMLLERRTYVSANQRAFSVWSGKCSSCGEFKYQEHPQPGMRYARVV